ncbi:pentapeptide repeat-containing protein [Dehalobacter sp. MCB1]|uniref:pentapeptide repeat-containing protein n=1 Tax=Dehalobacter sp. MCB1 TaxID=1844756 RepID=UPI0011C23BA6|nr:pentapeptide repeat-containing protein [Dehalobacter sp. MCB1]
MSIDLASSDPTSFRVPAGEILTKVNNGQPVEYDHVTITGDLDLSQLNPSTLEGALHETKVLGPLEKAIIINSPIRLNNCLIEGNVYMNNAIFGKVVNFNATRFNGSVYFQGSRFNGPSFFWASEFNKTTDFRNSTFIGFACFKYSKFDKNIDFTQSWFNGSADFSYLRFNESVDFVRVVFNGPADFSWSKFDRLNCQNSKFYSRVLFWGSTFNKAAFFRGVEFNGETNFLDSRFNGRAEFRDAKFNCIANFESSKFNNTASFWSAQFSQDAFFLGAQIESLDLSLAKYEKMYLRWDSINNSNLVYNVKCGATTYELLATNFRNLGFLLDFDNCYYKFRKEQFLHRNFLADPLGYILELGAWVFYGFGKRPLYPLAWSIGTILVFGAIWCIIGMNKRPHRCIWDKLYLLLSSFIFSATIFLSGTKLFIDPPKISLSNSLMNGVFTLERAFGAFFFILFFLAIGSTIVR